MARAARLVGAACALALAGCHAGSGGPGGTGGQGGQDAPSASCFAGDLSVLPAVTLVYQAPGGTLSSLTDGEAIPLIVPPQGGEVLVVGVRALNIDGCPVTMSTSLIVPSSGVVAAFERRPVTLEPSADGWLEPRNPAGLANFSNLPACPIAALGQALDGNSYRLDVKIEDLMGRQGEASATVVPTCDAAPDPASCHCLCAAGYVLGSACP